MKNRSCRREIANLDRLSDAFVTEPRLLGFVFLTEPVSKKAAPVNQPQNASAEWIPSDCNAVAIFLVRQKKSWVDSGSGNLPSE
jgi:hypothetical protein